MCPTKWSSSTHLDRTDSLSTRSIFLLGIGLLIAKPYRQDGTTSAIRLRQCMTRTSTCPKVALCRTSNLEGYRKVTAQQRVEQGSILISFCEGTIDARLRSVRNKIIKCLSSPSSSSAEGSWYFTSLSHPFVRIDKRYISVYFSYHPGGCLMYVNG